MGIEENTTDERELVSRAQQDPDAFGELYALYVDRIYRYVYHRVGNVYDAEDITSRTFFRALSHIQNYEDKGYPFSAWLYRIAHNLLSNWHRDHKRRPTVSIDALVLPDKHETRPETITLLDDDNLYLNEVIKELDARRQELLFLKFVEGFSNAEIGEIMGKSEGAIKSLYHRTLLALRKSIIKRGLDL